VSGQLELNLAFTFGLIGMGLGWKWGLSQVSGFYDSASAVKYLMFGLVLGTIYALFSDVLVLRDYLAFIRGERELVIMNFIIAVLLSISTSLLIMLLLTRKNLLSTKSGTTSGWSLGLGIGAMFSARFSFLSMDYYGIKASILIQVILFVVMLPLFEGALCSYQGSLSSKGFRFKSSFIASGGRFFFLMMLPAIFSLLIWWVVLIPIIMILYRKSISDWIPGSMTQEAKRRYRRIMADNLRRNKERPLVTGNSEKLITSSEE
tara:strand:- start:357 stop:1142 length:786 start_codon:yes stop_codon:yes gene_type:complete